MIVRPHTGREPGPAVETPPQVNEEKPSKSARKREYLGLQELGEALTRLRPSQLDALPLDDRLKRAVADAQGIHSHGALRRQRQLIGKLMRTADAEAIRRSFAQLGQGDLQDKRLFHNAEAWRDRICADGAAAVREFAAQTGGRAESLVGLVAELSAARNDQQRRSIRRRIFREVHGCLETPADPGATR